MTMVKLHKEKQYPQNYFKHNSLSVTKESQLPVHKVFEIVTSKSELAVT